MTVRDQGTGEVAAKAELVVSAGPDLGMRLLVCNTPRLVGRGRDADLRLSDRAISRRHVEIIAAAEGVEVRVVDGASPMTVDGDPHQARVFRIGDRFVIGRTALSVVGASNPATSLGVGREVTDVRTLLSHTSVGTRDLAAIFQLSERLDEVQREEQLSEVLAQWLAQTLHPGAAVRAADDVSDGAPEGIVEEVVGSQCLEITVPLIGAHPSGLRISLPGRTAVLSDESRRLLALAGRIAGSCVARLRALGRATDENAELRQLALGSATAFLGTSEAAQRVTMLLERLARSQAMALIVGETGVGKSFLARLIHENGPRADGPLRVINCASIPDNLVESELFGHERGAFTGADGAREGALESAAGGTILLDEIGDMPLPSQAKLLRVLEEKQFERLGSNVTIALQARVLCATNRDLKQMVEEGTFRADLYYRITVVSVPVPPLRERKDDIAALAIRFLGDLAPSAGRRVSGFSPAALEAFQRYAWPGNVRELKNVVEHALVLGDGEIIAPSDLPMDVAGSPPVPIEGNTVALPLDLATLELRAIKAALETTGGNRTRAAAILGINRVTLYKKLRALEAKSATGEAKSAASDAK